MSAGKDKQREDEKIAAGPKGQTLHFIGVDTWTIQKLSRPMSAGKGKQREDERRAVGPKGQTLDFIVVGTWSIQKLSWPMSAGKGKVKKELLARKVKHRFF